MYVNAAVRQMIDEAPRLARLDRAFGDSRREGAGITDTKAAGRRSSCPPPVKHASSGRQFSPAGRGRDEIHTWRTIMPGTVAPSGPLRPDRRADECVVRIGIVRALVVFAFAVDRVAVRAAALDADVEEAVPGRRPQVGLARHRRRRTRAPRPRCRSGRRCEMKRQATMPSGSPRFSTVIRRSSVTMSLHGAFAHRQDLRLAAFGVGRDARDDDRELTLRQRPPQAVADVAVVVIQAHADVRE